MRKPHQPRAAIEVAGEEAMAPTSRCQTVQNQVCSTSIAGKATISWTKASEDVRVSDHVLSTKKPKTASAAHHPRNISANAVLRPADMWTWVATSAGEEAYRINIVIGGWSRLMERRTGISPVHAVTVNGKKAVNGRVATVLGKTIAIVLRGSEIRMVRMVG